MRALGLRIYNLKTGACEHFLSPCGEIAVAGSELFVAPWDASEAGIDSAHGFMLAYDLISGTRTRTVEQPWLSKWVGHPAILLACAGTLYYTWQEQPEEELI